MHLFPPGTTLDCRQVPSWFRDLVRPTGPEGRPGRATVSFDADASTLLAEAGAVDGIVAVNSQGLSRAVLKQAGFAYSQRFAVVPNLAQARWFIPLDSGAVTSAGFALYSPAKFSARMKLAAVKIAARVGFRGWYRDEVWIAGREQPPLERLVRRVLSREDVCLALSAGAPEPARNRKASVAVLGSDGSTLAFAKLPSSTLAKQLVAQEAEALAELGKRFSGERCVVPRLLFAGEEDGRHALIQAPLPGKPTSPKITAAHRKFLDSLQTPSEKGPAAESLFFRRLQHRVAALGDKAHDLAAAIAGVAPTLMSAIVPKTIIHGDFAPWNIRHKRGWESIAVFDWEYAALDGLPLIDESHFELQVGLHLGNWTPEKAVQELDRTAGAAESFPTSWTRALQVIYLVDSVTRLLEEGYSPSDEMVVWYRRVLTLGPGAAKYWGEDPQ
jgi:hypothetical protein